MKPYIAIVVLLVALIAPSALMAEGTKKTILEPQDAVNLQNMILKTQRDLILKNPSSTILKDLRNLEKEIQALGEKKEWTVEDTLEYVVLNREATRLIERASKALDEVAPSIPPGTGTATPAASASTWPPTIPAVDPTTDPMSLKPVWVPRDTPDRILTGVGRTYARGSRLEINLSNPYSDLYYRVFDAEMVPVVFATGEVGQHFMPAAERKNVPVVRYIQVPPHQIRGKLKVFIFDRTTGAYLNRYDLPYDLTSSHNVSLF